MSINNNNNDNNEYKQLYLYVIIDTFPIGENARSRPAQRDRGPAYGRRLRAVRGRRQDRTVRPLDQGGHRRQERVSVMLYWHTKQPASKYKPGHAMDDIDRQSSIEIDRHLTYNEIETSSSKIGIEQRRKTMHVSY